MKATSPARFWDDYGMVVALALLCGYYSWATWSEQQPTGSAAGEQLAAQIIGQHPRGTRVLIVARAVAEDAEFARVLADRVVWHGLVVVETVRGEPADARAALERMTAAGDAGTLGVIACSHVTGTWTVFEDLPAKFSALRTAQVLTPHRYRWPNFLKLDNLRNVANQIAVIAILAIGMTMVIIAGGIDLSVGSLIALAAVVATLAIRDLAEIGRAHV